MPGVAHTSAGERRRRARPARSEHGFSLVEIIIVMVLIAIALLAAVSTLSSIRRGDTDSRYAVAASTVWRGIGAWRLDSKGTFPTASDMAGGGARFANLAGAPYVKRWPEDPRTGQPLALVPSTRATAPTTSTPNTVQYASNQTTAWIAAYGHDGRLLFTRSAVAGGSPEAPVG